MWNDLAGALARATSLQAALDAVVAETARVLRARTCIVEQIDRTWKIVAQARGGLDLSISDLPRAFDVIASSPPGAAIDLTVVQRGTWRAIPLAVADHAARTLLLEGDRLGHEQMALAELTMWLPAALRAASEGAARSRTERLALDVNRLARRLGRAATIEAVAHRVVSQVAKSLAADRVALAMPRPDEDRLAVVAVHGGPTEAIRRVRMEPGAWVMGHVFASGRAVHIRDLRQAGGALDGRRSYRTSSFVAVPVALARTVIGVLSATDKIDGSPFDRHDRIALSGFASVGALGLAAARSQTEIERLGRAANIDPVTGVFNRTYLETRLDEEFERARRAGGALAILMVDIDDFKAINDSYGHPRGDSVLQAVGGVLRSTIRIFDVCARYGGDEFAILMPNSDESNALASAERIRRRVYESCTRDYQFEPTQPLTVSIGVATAQRADTPAHLIHRADAALYAAKRDGKNAVRSATDHRLLPPPAPSR